MFLVLYSVPSDNYYIAYSTLGPYDLSFKINKKPGEPTISALCQRNEDNYKCSHQIQNLRID